MQPPILSLLWEWLPDFQTVLSDISYVPTPESDRKYLEDTSFAGMVLRWRRAGAYEGGDGFFSATHWTKLTADHWEVPLLATAAYLISIPLLKRLVAARGKFDVRRFAFWWNASLSVFSLGGVLACVPVILDTLPRSGLYFTICAPPAWYGTGLSGFFVALFVYSKLWELGDTVLLLLAGKPVIALQWWHHSTVLLYCWHSYATRIATGAWFACMNYTVHSVMYAYFAATTTKYRRMVHPYAIYITFLQLAQMVVGIFVTIRAVLYQASGEVCYVNRTNSLLGLAMYASYFVLFLKLFVENYCLKKRASSPEPPPSKAPAPKPVKEDSKELDTCMDSKELEKPTIGVRKRFLFGEYACQHSLSVGG
mmetsp:Transcript_45335/g.105184  ORF Transcript_45335/g.105184 Transcript_45335/m.105184 type:complete len:366 (+) Transcript_45335:58-1155(+)